MGDDNSHASGVDDAGARDHEDMKEGRLRHLRAVGFSSLAILLYLLLADTAVETFIGGSPPVRWWVAVIVAIYLAAVAALWGRRHPLWERVNWKTRAAASLFVFLGLFTITVWVPDGIANGVRLLGQTTSTLLVIITGTAVALSGMMLMRPRYPHPAVRWAIAALALYAVIAFLRALPAGTPYPDLFRGESFWRWLPRWVQGAFVGAFILVPAGILSRLAGGALRTARRELHVRGAHILALSMSLAIALAGLNAPRETVQAQGKISDRGPGLRRQPLDALALPVPRTFDLTHVDPVYFAVALGKDPTTIFEFVRDNIAYEAYTGALRGPRGTLLAMAGNSVDRAALLASLLQQAGYRVRYARGNLPDSDARDLVLSMWADQPKPSRAASGPPTAVRPPNQLTILAARDYALVRDQVRKANVSARAPELTLDALVAESRPHYWVQWLKNDAWIDLDPSFSDSTPGRTYARAEDTFNVLPEAIFHRVTIRVRIEESTGDAPSTRDVLIYSSKAPDLSGLDLLLTHQPENWRGPVTSLSGALAGAIADTGRIKPVLIVGGQFTAGDVFQTRLRTAGIGAVQSLLSGEGTRTKVPIAVGEWLEFGLSDPDGHTETVVREIYDITGRARRERKQFLSWDEIRSRTENESAFDPTKATYGIFVSMGPIDATHLSRVDSPPPAERAHVDIRGALRRINIAFAVTSDALLARAGRVDRALIRSYPDRPRVQITAFYSLPDRGEVTLDLRREGSRIVTLGSHPEDILAARILEGVLNGTLERLVMEHATSAASPNLRWSPVVSTSLIFDRGRAENVPTLLLPAEASRLGAGIPEDVLRRLREDLPPGYLAIAPQRPVVVAGVSRFGWWQVNPRSGETIAVTDQGLYGAEYVELTTQDVLGPVYYVGTNSEGYVTLFGPILDESALDEFVWNLLREGYTPLDNPPWLPLIWPK